METNKMEINLEKKKQIQFSKGVVKYILLGIVMVLLLCSISMIYFKVNTNPFNGSWYLYSYIRDGKEEIVENNDSLDDNAFGRLNIKCQNDKLSWEIITRQDGEVQPTYSMKLKENLEFYSNGLIIELKKIDNSFKGKYDIEGEWEAFSFQDTREDAEEYDEDREEMDFFLSNKVEENRIICSIILNKQKADMIFELKDKSLEVTLGDEKQIFKKVDEDKEFVLKNTYMAIEYGEKLSTDIRDYIDNELTSKSLISKIKMDTSKIKLVENKDYPAIGEYEIVFTYKDKNEILYLDVKDTKEPNFINLKSELEFVKNKKPSEKELSNIFNAKDLDKCTISVDDSRVDYSKLGIYNATVTAKDVSGNTATEDITINVVNKIGQKLEKIETEDEALDIVVNSEHYKNIIKRLNLKSTPFFMCDTDTTNGMNGYVIYSRVDNPAAGEGITNHVATYFVSEYGQIFWYDRMNGDELVEVN